MRGDRKRASRSTTTYRRRRLGASLLLQHLNISSTFPCRIHYRFSYKQQMCNIMFLVHRIFLFNHRACKQIQFDFERLLFCKTYSAYNCCFYIYCSHKINPLKSSKSALTPMMLVSPSEAVHGQSTSLKSPTSPNSSKRVKLPSVIKVTPTTRPVQTISIFGIAFSCSFNQVHSFKHSLNQVFSFDKCRCCVLSWWQYLLTWNYKHGLFFFVVASADMFIPAIDAINDFVAAIADTHALPRIRTASGVDLKKSITQLRCAGKTNRFEVYHCRAPSEHCFVMQASSCSSAQSSQCIKPLHILRIWTVQLLLNVTKSVSGSGLQVSLTFARTSLR